MKLGIYEHYKGKQYEVIDIARHSETLEELVLYTDKTFGKNSLWVRPKSMFCETVFVDGREQPRFRFIG